MPQSHDDGRPRLRSGLDVSQRVLGGFGSLCLVLMGAVATLQIATRPLPPEMIPFSTGWTTELIRYLMVFMTAAGVPYAMYNGSHISIRPLIERLSESWFRRLLVLSNLLIVLMSGLLVLSGVTVAERTIDQSLRTLTWLKIGYGHLFLAAMFAVTIVYATVQVFDPDSLTDDDEDTDRESQGQDDERVTDE